MQNAFFYCNKSTNFSESAVIFMLSYIFLKIHPVNILLRCTFAWMKSLLLWCFFKIVDKILIKSVY